MEEHFGGMMLAFFSFILVISLYLQIRSKRSRIHERAAVEPLLSDSSGTVFSPELSQPKAQFNFFSQSEADNLLMISVFARPNSRFVSYDLLQAIASTGMEFGEMNIFHYYQRTPQGKKVILFSLASATKPGEFDLDRMGNFSCVGLTLFMDMTQVPNPLQAFYLMIGTAEQLADDLDGELRANPRSVWNAGVFQAYEQRIMQHAQAVAM